MSYTKTAEEMNAIIEGGKRMGEILEKLTEMVKPGVSTLEIDVAAEKMIRAAGGVPAFKGYSPRGMKPFSGTICASVNEEVVHGIPSAGKMLREGDLFTIDIGMQWPSQGTRNKEQGTNGYFTDTAVTIAVGNISEENAKLMRVTREALERGIQACVAGNTVADIGKAVEDYVKSQGDYGIVRDLCGHGVGHAVHEEPYVLNYYDKALEVWELKPGVVLAIEPMITLGGYQVKTRPDQWTVVTTDGSWSAHFEHTVVITEDGSVVVTRRPGEKT